MILHLISIGVFNSLNLFLILSCTSTCAYVHIVRTRTSITYTYFTLYLYVHIVLHICTYTLYEHVVRTRLHVVRTHCTYRMGVSVLRIVYMAVTVTRTSLSTSHSPTRQGKINFGLTQRPVGVWLSRFVVAYLNR